MKKFFCGKGIVHLLFFFLSLQAFASSDTSILRITGSVRDTIEQKPLSKASILLLSASDSILVAAVRSDDQGRFVLNASAGTAYTLLISYPKYTDRVEDIPATTRSVMELGTVALNTKAFVMKEIIIRNTSPIRIKGDTTELIADSFKVSPNADVQELLRRMPGFQINAKGEIIAQGQKVQKVFVDGEEFFSDDPAVVTKNLRADAIERVQVYDRKSDQAAFTGIDDGVKEKTLNLKLKESAKNGYFGKAEMGSNANQYQQGKLMGNVFKGKRKMAAYATTNNSQFEGLNWEETRNFSDGGNTSMEMTDGGGIAITWNSDDDYSENKGLPLQQTAGAFYGNKWKGFTSGTGAQYQRIRMNVESQGLSTTILPDYSLDNLSSGSQVQNKERYKVNTKNEWGTDSTGLFKLSLTGSKTTRSSASGNTSFTTRDGTNVNASSRTTISHQDDQKVDGNLSYRKKLSKTGRSISADVSMVLNEQASDGTLNATNTFYQSNGSLFRTDLIDQLKDGQQTGTTSSASIVYTEPLSKKSFLLFKYNLGIGTNEAERNTYGKTGAGAYDALVDSLSNHFRFNNYSNSGALHYRFTGKKLTMTIGSGVGRVKYQSNDLETLTSRSTRFTNILPTASVKYQFKAQRSLNINYNGTPQNPTLQQIQPLIDNADPLNLQIGNAALRQAFRNEMRITFQDYRMSEDRSIYATASFNNLLNGITSSSTIDNFGKRLSQFVNANGNYSYDMRLVFDRKIVKDLSGGIELETNGNRSINFINGQRNVNDYSVRRVSVNFGHWSDSWLSFYGSIRFGKTTTRSSLRADMNNSFNTISGYGNVSMSFKKQKTYVDVWTDIDRYGSNSIFSSPVQIIRVTPSIRKILTKNDALEGKISVFDLFNQNQNVERNVYTNFLSQMTYNTIRRYVMFTLTYNFKNKSAAAVNK